MKILRTFAVGAALAMLAITAHAASPPPATASPSWDVTVYAGATDSKSGDVGLAVDHTVIGPIAVEASWDHAFVPGTFPTTQEGVTSFIKSSRIGDRGDAAIKINIPTGTRWQPYGFGGVGYQAVAKGPSGAEFELGAGTRYRLIGTLAADLRWTRYETFGSSVASNAFKLGIAVGFP